MTKLLTAAIILLAISCNTPSNEAQPAPAAEAKTPHDYGMKASYSTDFSLGSEALGDSVIKLWKDFDANTLSASMFADSVTAMFPGFTAKVARDSMLAMTKAERGAMDSCTTTLDALVPLKASNKEESVVCIWGVEKSVIKGKKQSRDLHEVWGFNNDGKVIWIKQYVN
jgi:hypothetical protein